MIAAENRASLLSASEGKAPAPMGDTAICGVSYVMRDHQDRFAEHASENRNRSKLVSPQKRMTRKAA